MAEPTATLEETDAFLKEIRGDEDEVLKWCVSIRRLSLGGTEARGPVTPVLNSFRQRGLQLLKAELDSLEADTIRLHHMGGNPPPTPADLPRSPGVESTPAVRSADRLAQEEDVDKSATGGVQQAWIRSLAGLNSRLLEHSRRIIEIQKALAYGNHEPWAARSAQWEK